MRGVSRVVESAVVSALLGLAGLGACSTPTTTSSSDGSGSSGASEATGSTSSSGASSTSGMERHDDAAVVSVTVDGELYCNGPDATVTITMQNTGNTTWTTSGYHLAVEASANWFGFQSWLSLRRPVAPGDTYSFQDTATAGDGGGLGYDETVSWRMQRNAEDPFGAAATSSFSSSPCDACCWSFEKDAAVSSTEIPSSLGCGETAIALITMENIGGATWYSDGYRLAMTGGSEELASQEEIHIDGHVVEGERFTFETVLHAPISSGAGYDVIATWQMRGYSELFGEVVSQNIFVHGCPDTTSSNNTATSTSTSSAGSASTTSISSVSSTSTAGTSSGTHSASTSASTGATSSTFSLGTSSASSSVSTSGTSASSTVGPGSSTTASGAASTTSTTGASSSTGG